jgi:hypothetical protein
VSVSNKIETSAENSLQRGPVSSSLVAYAQALPISPSRLSGYDLVTFVGDLVAHAKSHLTQNAVVIPVLQTFNTLIGGDALDRLCEDSEGLQRFVRTIEDYWIVLNALVQPPRASCPCLAECGSPEERREDTRVYEIVCSYFSFGYRSLICALRVVNLLPFTRLSNVCVPRLVDFLAHPFPKVRHISLLPAFFKFLTYALGTNRHC